MRQDSADEQRLIKEMAERHGVSPDVVLTVRAALQAGRGRQAQFSHPELGGMGQWSQGGMVMIGDMFNSGLKARVDSLCGELSAWLGRTQVRPAASTQLQGQFQGHADTNFPGSRSEPTWWPSDLGMPTAAGSQNGLHYAFFPEARCLAINHQGQVTLHDTGQHQITGVSQQQGGGQSLTFTSQRGVVRVVDLPLLKAEAPDQDTEPPEPTSRSPQEVATASTGPNLQANKQGRVDTPAENIVAVIERLAALRRQGVLTEEEFTAKKTELLSRL